MCLQVIRSNDWEFQFRNPEKKVKQEKSFFEEEKYYYNYLNEVKKENLIIEREILLHNSKTTLRIYKLKKKTPLQNRHKF
jgi:hypothetical protein